MAEIGGNDHMVLPIIGKEIKLKLKNGETVIAMRNSCDENELFLRTKIV